MLTPYYEHAGITIYHGDCREIAPLVRGGALVVSDPPFNVGYHYAGYSDQVSEAEYRDLCRRALMPPSVVVHYPEDLFKVSRWLGEDPAKCVAWTYNAHTPRKWRMVSWFGIVPDFSLVKQPYLNRTDRRVIARIEAGSEGCDLWDWWHEEQVKNVCLEKTEHPCQMPLEVMQKAIAITQTEPILDPFCGSGTTLLAAKNLGRRSIGIEIEERYCEIAAKRLAQEVFEFDAPCLPEVKLHPVIGLEEK